MNSLLAYSAPVVVDQDTHQNLRPSGTYNDGAQDWWLYLCDEILAADKVIGAWNADGSVLVTATDPDGEPTAWYPIGPDYLTYIRPLGNAEGIASDSLDFHHWLGGGQRYLQDVPAPATLAEYPADEQPIILRMDRRFDDTPGFEGEGWVATIEFADPNRPPNARAIGIYDQNWAFIYTTGAFILTDQGDGTQKWQTVNPPGRVTAAPEPIYYALLFGSAQEGRMTLTGTQDGREDYFWESNQGPLPGEEWIDSGQTVTGNFGTITGVSGDKNEFPLGVQVRIEGLEGVVDAYWLGGAGIAILPVRQYTIGATIEIWGTP